MRWYRCSRVFNLGNCIWAVTVTLFAAPHVAVARTVTVGSASASPGWVVSIPVTLSGTSGTVGTQNEIVYDPGNYSIQANTDGSPKCTTNSSIDKTSTKFEFLPFGCLKTQCNTVRAIVVSTNNTQAIADGNLYTCQVQIGAATPPGTYILLNYNAKAADSTGNNLSLTTQNGQIQVTQSCGCGCP